MGKNTQGVKQGVIWVAFWVPRGAPSFPMPKAPWLRKEPLSNLCSRTDTSLCAPLLPWLIGCSLCTGLNPAHTMHGEGGLISIFNLKVGIVTVLDSLQAMDMCPFVAGKAQVEAVKRGWLQEEDTLLLLALPEDSIYRWPQLSKHSFMVNNKVSTVCKPTAPLRARRNVEPRKEGSKKGTVESASSVDPRLNPDQTHHVAADEVAAFWPFSGIPSQPPH